MAINQLQFSQRYEKLRAQGVPDEEAMRQAEEYATIRPATQQTKRRKSPLARAIVWGRRKARELYYGPTTYLRESPAERKKRVELEKEK